MYCPFLISLLFLAVLESSSARNCDLGFIKNNGICEPCPPGTYNEREGAKSCKKCPPGTFSPYSGAPDEDVCRPCFDDTFNPVAGATACQSCPPGSMSRCGAKKCLKCGPGTRIWSVRPGDDDTCVPCEKGYYSSSASNRDCKICPLGKTGPRGSDNVNKCKKCPPGRYGPSCLECHSFRFFFNEDTGSCELCPAGSVRERGAVKCTKCPAGTFVAFAKRDGNFETFCKACPQGKTSGRGSIICKKPGRSCRKGLFENRDGGCVSCNQGYFRNETTKECEKCPPGSTSLGGLRNKCVFCEGELVPDFDNALCRCRPGLYYEKGKCFPCPGGTGGNFANPELRGRNGCIKCFKGTFAKPGSAKCSPCPFGTVALKDRSESCTPCPKGTVPPFVNQLSCVVLKTGCPLGQKNQYSWGSDCKRIKK